MRNRKIQPHSVWAQVLLLLSVEGRQKESQSKEGVTSSQGSTALLDCNLFLSNRKGLSVNIHFGVKKWVRCVHTTTAEDFEFV